MKKILLLLLCVPLIGFGHIEDIQKEIITIADILRFFSVTTLLIIFGIILTLSSIKKTLSSIKKQLNKSNLHYEDISKRINDLTEEYHREKEVDEVLREMEIKDKAKLIYKERSERDDRRAKLSPEDIEAERLKEEKATLSDFFNNIDDLFHEAAFIVVKHESVSTASIQRRLKIGYNRAGRIMDQLQVAGIIGGFQGYHQVIVQHDNILLVFCARTINKAYELKIISKEKADIFWMKFKDFYPNKRKDWTNDWIKLSSTIKSK